MKLSDATQRPAPQPDVDAAPAAAGPRGAAAMGAGEGVHKHRHSLGRKKARGRVSRADELAFLPAALEIVETPPSPIGRAIAFTLMAVFASAVGWAIIGTVDIVAVATGRIIPSGRTKIIQPFETGVVRAIHVHDGQSVKAGDVLIEFDPTMIGAELGHIRSDLVSAQLDAARLRAALAGGDDPVGQFVSPQGATRDQIETHRRLLANQHDEQASKIANIEWQEAQKKAEQATIAATVDKIDATLPLLKERVDVRQHLMQKELGSKLMFLSEYQDYVGQQRELLVQKSRMREIEAALSGLAESRRKTEVEYRRTLLDDLVKAEQRVAALAQDAIKADSRTRLQSLTAPEDGVVQQLAVHTVGGVVTPAQALMAIVPAESQLEIEAMVSNRDIGFVEAGQEAAIKIDTFNFTRYGLLHGKVLTVSHDAISRDRPQDRTADKAQGPDAGSSEPNGQQLVYAGRVSLDRTEMKIDNRQVNLSPGMAVTVEIKTGTRSIISYLLSPLVRYEHDSFRER
jgi:hemolysin D